VGVKKKDWFAYEAVYIWRLNAGGKFIISDVVKFHI